MATDLLIAGCLIVWCATVAFRACRRYSLRHPGGAQFALIGSIGLALWIFWSSSYSLRWAELLPLGGVLLIANASVLLIVCAGGFLLGVDRISQLRKIVGAGVLLTTAAISIASAIFRPIWEPIELDPQSTWKDGVCMQSHEASCAPAAAATLLHFHGISASEQLMARRCFTSQNGTLTLGAFRGLCATLNGQDYAARAVVCEPNQVPEWTIDDHLPMLAMVDFQEQLQRSAVQVASNAAVSEHSWLAALCRMPQRSRGLETGRHAVVILQRLEDGRLLVADPAVGKIRWSDEYFRDIWVGEGMYLIAK